MEQRRKGTGEMVRGEMARRGDMARRRKMARRGEIVRRGGW